VRIDAVRALEQLDGVESMLLLRLKAHSGDKEPHILGQVFDSLLSLENERAVAFVSQFLAGKDEEVRGEAALSLGGSRLPAAISILIETWKTRVRATEFRSVLLRALSASRHETALEFLLGLVKTGLSRDADAALEALELHKDSPEIQQLIKEARKRGTTRIDDVPD
jgi:HEAT repeat protein